MNVTELQQWEASLQQELRLRGADGREVGEALATVREYCHDAGTHPDEAFGDPVAYAGTLRPAPIRPATVGAQILPNLVTTGAFLMSLYLPGGGASDQVTVRLGAPLAMLAFALFSVVVVWLNRRRVGWRPYTVVVAVFLVGAWFLMQQSKPLGELPLWTLWLLDALLVGMACWVTVHGRRDRPRDPATGQDLTWPSEPASLAWWFPALAAFLLLVKVVPSIL